MPDARRDPPPPLPSLIAGLPGEALIRQGVADLRAGRNSIPAWVVQIARTRLTQAGIPLPSPAIAPGQEPELELYRTLRAQGEGDAYSRYNALLRELVSFEQALDHRLTAAARRSPV